MPYTFLLYELWKFNIDVFKIISFKIFILYTYFFKKVT